MKSKEWFGLIAIAVMILFSIVFEVINYTHVTTVKGEVIDKYTKRSNDHDKFYIVVKQDDSSEKVIVNKDSVFMMKFDSADVQAQVKNGEKYEFKLRGYRVPVLSMFPNVDTFENRK
ncbi:MULTISPECIES: hypothetical protein [Bacillus]|uniref:hypothetical protein n=1 Tax=Bacillus TaxID=1386 RepID=UPI0010BDA098|nr:hypothetical protein [Bacillus cereus]MCU5485153.1 DUF1523 family protein [Bacillus cereus]TKI20934.1 hypothetical protein FC683_28335 [Bacillus cereus]